MTGQRVLRYGVVGTGMMGVEHIENIAAMNDATVTALADPNPDSRARARCVTGVVAVEFDDHVGLLESGLCDAVVIASPNHTHAGVVTDVMRTDLHALVEKPLCTTVADCESLVALSAQRAPGVVTWMAMEYRYMPAVAELVRLVRNGTVGRPRMVAIREHRFPFLDKVDDWNRLNANTGGTLIEKACHFFDLMNLVLDERPTRVMASGGQDVNHLDEWYDGRRSDVLDNAFVIVDYASGARAMLDLCMFAEATSDQEEMSAVGELGKVVARLPSNIVQVGRRGEHWIGRVDEYVAVDERVAHHGMHHGASYIEHLLFAEAIRTGGSPAVTIDDGYVAVATGAAAHRSIDVGRPVELVEVMENEQ